MAQQQPTINLNISFSDPETAAAFASAFGNGEAVQALVAMLSGQGSAGQNHRVKAARAPRAVAETAQGEWTAKQYRDWVKAHEAKTGVPITDGISGVPMTGPLSKAWKVWLDGFIAEVDGEPGEEPEFREDAEVVEPELEATPVEEPQERKAAPARKRTGGRLLQRQQRAAQ